MKKYLCLLFVAVLAISCQKQKTPQGEKPLARVHDKYLYPADINGIVPSGVTGKDSAGMVRDFIEKWIQNQLLLNKAENNLTDNEKNVEDQIESYRSSLLIYAYQQSYLQQNLDTLVSDTIIATYYRENQSNFILGETLVKAVFIKVPVNAPELYKLRQWYRSDNDEDIKKLEGYCFQNAKVYDHFNDGWVNVNEVVRMIPSGSASLNSLISRKYLESKDQNFYYFLNLKEIAPEGTVSPFELVKNDIHSIILNKRKVELINKLETDIFSDAQNRDQFTIY
jgi:hypothetical protein